MLKRKNKFLKSRKQKFEEIIKLYSSDNFSNKTITFDDGSKEEIDVIIYATGYKISFPFFSDSFLKVKNNDIETIGAIKNNLNESIISKLLEITSAENGDLILLELTPLKIKKQVGLKFLNNSPTTT